MGEDDTIEASDAEDLSWCPEDCVGQCCVACQGQGCVLQPCPMSKTKEECNCADDGK